MNDNNFGFFWNILSCLLFFWLGTEAQKKYDSETKRDLEFEELKRQIREMRSKGY